MEIYFILVRPAVPENIGAAARAIKTMGFSRLRVVGSTQHLEKKAKILAHGAGDVLGSIESFDNLPEAVKGISWVIGTSAKQRLAKRYSYPADEVESLIRSKSKTVKSVAIVFGCEEAGLSNTDLGCCDTLAYIPIAQKYPSLNLGQAVMIFAYSLRKIDTVNEKILEDKVDNDSFAFLKDKVRRVLQGLNLNHKDKVYQWAMERLGVLGATDIKFLHLLLRKIAAKTIDIKENTDSGK